MSDGGRTSRGEVSGVVFKRGANEDGSTLLFATEDDPDVAFGTKEGIFQETGIEREFERVGDVGVMKEGAQRARDVSDVNDIIGKVSRGDASSSSGRATLIHAYADRLAALDKLRRTMTDGSRSDELEKAVENIDERADGGCPHWVCVFSVRFEPFLRNREKCESLWQSFGKRARGGGIGLRKGEGREAGA